MTNSKGKCVRKGQHWSLARREGQWVAVGSCGQLWAVSEQGCKTVGLEYEIGRPDCTCNSLVVHGLQYHLASGENFLGVVNILMMDIKAFSRLLVRHNSAVCIPAKSIHVETSHSVSTCKLP